MRTVAEMCLRDLGHGPPAPAGLPARPVNASSAGAVHGIEYVLRLKALLEHLEERKVPVRPLFRITVAWEVGNGKQAVKVYEARSPSQAWQAALVETVGLPVPGQGSGPGPLGAQASAGFQFPHDGAQAQAQAQQGSDEFVDIRPRLPTQASGGAGPGVGGSGGGGGGGGGVGAGFVQGPIPTGAADGEELYEEPDEEEIELRNRLTELRRAHSRAFRQVPPPALTSVCPGKDRTAFTIAHCGVRADTACTSVTQEQDAGMQASVAPRLLLEQVDTLVDEGVLRLIEGMETAIDCEAYQFMDSRDDGDEPRRGVSLVLRALAKMHYKTRYLEKILRRQVGATAPGTDPPRPIPQPFLADRPPHRCLGQYPFRAGAAAYPLMASKEDIEARKRMREERTQLDKVGTTGTHGPPPSHRLTHRHRLPVGHPVYACPCHPTGGDGSEERKPRQVPGL